MSKPVIRMKGGGNTNTYSDVKQTTTNLPEYAEPYVKDLYARAGFETAQEYDPYTGQRVADFSPMEQEALARYGELGMSGTSEEMNQAGRYALEAGNMPINTEFTNAYGQAGELNGAGDYNNQQRESEYKAGQYKPKYKADQRQSNYTAAQYNMGFEAGNMYGESLDPYQDQYMQDVVDIEKREAARQADMRHSATGLDAAGMGGLGGYREAIMRAEEERNLAQNMSDIQTKGSQQAFLNAQQAYEADRQARGMQEQFGQSSFGMNEAARQAQEQFAQSQFATNESARQAQEQFGQSAFGMNEAARQAQEQFGQSQFGLNSANDQFAAQMSMDQYSAYEAAKQQAAQLGLTAQQMEQAGQMALADNKLASAGMLGDFAGQRQAMEMDRLAAMQQAGERQRALQQAGLDIGYEDFVRQRDWGKEQLAFYNDMIQGNQIKPGETTAQYMNGPSTGQTMLGGGIGALGLWNAMSKNGYAGG